MMRIPILLLSLLITVPSLVHSSSTVELCACPSAPCAGACQTFNIGECQPFYQCFAQVNGLFGYIKPEFVPNETNKVVVNVHGDSDCNVTAFDPITNGWAGSCNAECWSQTSNIGSGQCKSSDDSTSTSSAMHKVMKRQLLLLTVLGTSYSLLLW